MRSFIAFLLSAAFIVLALVIIPVERLFNHMTDSDQVVDVVRQSTLYEQLLRQTSDRIFSNDVFRKLDDSPMAMSASEMSGHLQSAFPKEWFLNTIKAVHGRAIARLDPLPNQASFSISIGDRKEVLMENLTKHFVTRYDQLPDCPPGELARRRRLAAAQGADVTVPDCKLPEPIRGSIIASFQKRLAASLAVLPDTLHVFPHAAASESEFIAAFREIRFFAGDARLAGYGLLLVLLGLSGLIHYRQPKIMVRRLGTPLVWAGLWLGGLSGAGFWFFLKSGLSGLTAPSMTAATETTSLITPLMIANFTDVLMKDYCYDLLLSGVLMFALGMGLKAVARFGMQDAVES